MPSVPVVTPEELLAERRPPAPETGGPRRRRLWPGLVWAAFVAASLLAMDLWDLATWGWVVPVVAATMAVVTAWRVPTLDWLARRPDRLDLLVIGACYVAVVGLFRLAFVGFGTDQVLGLFLSFAGGLLVGVVGPVVYTVWWRRRSLRTLGLGGHDLRATVGLGLLLAVVQFAMTLWRVSLPAPVDWVPLLVMSLVVGLFEAVFFRGFVQGRLRTSFGTVPSILGAAVLYSGYHVGYGMDVDELVFLFGLGVVYAIAYRLVDNLLVLWPLLTPMGAFFNNLQSGDIELPWASIAGFADVLAVMIAVIWLAARRQRRARSRPRPLAAGG